MKKRVISIRVYVPLKLNSKKDLKLLSSRFYFFVPTNFRIFRTIICAYSIYLMHNLLAFYLYIYFNLKLHTNLFEATPLQRLYLYTYTGCKGPPGSVYL